MLTQVNAHCESLIDFIAEAPSSYHAAATIAQQLRDSGFRQQLESEPWSSEPGGHLVVRDGTVLAWQIPPQATSEIEFRIAAAHTDSPGFKLKPAPDFTRFGWQQLGMEVYGGPLLNSWLDRELGLAGRLIDTGGAERLVRTEAIMRIPQLAIHLNRGVNDQGLKLDRQQHTQPVWGCGAGGDILAYLGSLVGWEDSDISGFEIYAYDTARGNRFGVAAEFLASGRLDNLVSVHASLVALLAVAAQPPTRPADGATLVPVLAAFDHEEVGSRSRSGAAGPVLEMLLRRIVADLAGTEDAYHRALARSFCISADASHSVHPNYASHHDPANHPLINNGVVLKLNAGQSYATDAVGVARWNHYCERAGVPVQAFVGNNDITCGSTVGPIIAARLGITTVDVGVPLLSMHSAREMCGVADPYALAQVFREFWSD